MTEEPRLQPPLMLAYDGFTPARDPRARWVLPGYLVGILVCGLAYGLVRTSYNLRTTPNDSVFAACLEGFIAPLGFELFALLPACLGLGLCLWYREKFLRDVRFARFRIALLSGFIAGLYPLPLLNILPLRTDMHTAVFLIAALVWHLLFPVAAGFWLCYRSHLRD